jgi:hypothetical protein
MTEHLGSRGECRFLHDTAQHVPDIAASAGKSCDLDHNTKPFGAGALRPLPARLGPANPPGDCVTRTPPAAGSVASPPLPLPETPKTEGWENKRWRHLPDPVGFSTVLELAMATWRFSFGSSYQHRASSRQQRAASTNVAVSGDPGPLASTDMADLNLSSKDAGQSSVEAMCWSNDAGRSSKAAKRSRTDRLHGAYSGRLGVKTSRLSTGSSPSTSPQWVTFEGMTSRPPGPMSCVSSPT